MISSGEQQRLHGNIQAGTEIFGGGGHGLQKTAVDGELQLEGGGAKERERSLFTYFRLGALTFH